jgi:hypothetical protein
MAHDVGSLLVARPFIFACDGWYKVFKNASSYPRCEYCAREFDKIKSIQTRIVRERPHLAKLSPSELFQKMYNKLKEDE